MRMSAYGCIWRYVIHGIIIYIYIFIYKSIVVLLLMVPSWALSIAPFLNPPADGLSLITLQQPQGASERSESPSACGLKKGSIKRPINLIDDTLFATFDLIHNIIIRKTVILYFKEPISHFNPTCNV